MNTVVIQRLLAQIMNPPTASAWDAPHPRLVRLAAACYLLLDPDTERFILNRLEGLLQEVSRNTTRRLVEDTRAVRGRVLWGPTIAARAVAQQGAQPYVFQELRRRYDTPENQLLRLLIDQCAAAQALVPPEIRAGGAYFAADGNGSWQDSAPRLRRIEEILLRARLSPMLRDVPLPDRITPQMIVRAETARNENYAFVAKCARRYAAMRDPLGWRAALRAISRRVLVLPHPTDPAADTWIGLAASLVRGSGETSNA